MQSIWGRAGLRPLLIGLAALLVGFSLDLPKRLIGSAERDAPESERSGSVSVPKRSFTLASVSASVSPAEVAAVPKSAPDAGSPRASFAERFSAVFWFYGDGEDKDVVRREDGAPAGDDEVVEVEETPQTTTLPPRVHDGTRTAVYVIADHTVYLPGGGRLEAHSGLGHRVDDPRFINVKNRGPTPPGVYDLVMRERRFHGVRAIRLLPVDESRMFGRDGILAHSYMLRGSRAQSNGCVVFRDYPAFLAAFLKGEVDRIVVVERLEDAPERPHNIGQANLTNHAKRKLKHVASR